MQKKIYTFLNRNSRNLLIAAACVLTAGCPGGGGDDAAPASVTPPSVQSIPLVPSGFVPGTITSNSIQFNWTNNSSDVLLITVEMCSGSACTTFTEVSRSPYGPTATTHTENGLASDTSYRFRLKATNSAGSSDYLTSGDIRTPALANSSLTVGSITPSSINFSWVINEGAATAMQVQRCDGVNCSNFANTFSSPLSAAATTYTEFGMGEATPHRFRVRAVTATGFSDWLTTSDIYTLPNTPVLLAGNVLSSSAINLTWVDQSNIETAYDLERCLGSGCTTFAAVSGSPFAPDTISFSDTGLVSGTIYRYRVRARTAASTGSWLTSSNFTTLTAPVAPLACTSPKTKVVDRGLKGSVAGVGRGLWSDVKIIPGTQSTATAYYDGSVTGGAANIKISWWNGSEFIIENVSADRFVGVGSATWVKLGFLSTGIPVVVWTTGGTVVKAAMRSAALNVSGSWSVGIIDDVTGAANRTASISISPSDSVAVAYLTNTLTTGRARFIYCAAPCNTPADFVPMTTVGDSIEANNIGVGVLGIATAWCNTAASGAPNYAPSVAYFGGGTLGVRYAVCTGSINTCRSATGWTGISGVATPNPVSIDMQTDPTLYRDGVRLLVKPATGTAMNAYVTSAGCQAPVSIVAGGAIGAATTGTVWSRLMRDASGLFHVVANDAAASVFYHNSNTNNFQTTTWNGAGTIETGTGLLPVANAGAGSADIAKDNAMIYTSYGLAIAPFNLNLGVINDITIPSNNGASVFYSILPDNSGSINMPLAAGNQVRNVSSALSATNRPAVAYVDYSSGALTAGRLKYAVRSGTTADSHWTMSIIPSTVNPLFPSLAFDQSGKPWISYYDSGTFRYYLVTNSSSDGMGSWTQYQVPIGAKAASGVAPATDDTAVAMYYSGGVSQPVVIFMNSTVAGGQGIRAVRLNPTTGQFGNIVMVDTLGASFGTRLTADFDLNGNIVIAYYDLTTTTVKFNVTTNGGATWRPASAQITAVTVGREGLSIKLNPSTGRPAVSYYDRLNNNVYLNSCNTALSSCHVSGNWSQTLAQSSTAVGVSGITATANEQLLNTSLTFSADGVPYISYATGIALSSNTLTPGLALTDATTGFSPTLPVMLAAAASAGATPSTFYNTTSPINFSQNGFSVSALRGLGGELFNFHIGPNNWLYSTSCGD